MDELDKLIAGAGNQVRVSKSPNAFAENCGKCRGTGRFIGRNGNFFGACFNCKGTGKVTFKTSSDQRAKKRAAVEARKVNEAETSIEAFKVANPAEYEWLVACPDLNFAVAMLANIRKWGSLTVNQLAACTRAVEKRKASIERAAANDRNAPQVDTAGIDRLKAAFDKARDAAAAKATGLTIRNPKISIAGMTISPAKATSKNPGALYVKQAGEYLGKIDNGKFLAVAACSDAQRALVLKFIADPKEAAKAYGQETGVCCICNAVLKSKWRLEGIGPICATKFGW